MNTRKLGIIIVVLAVLGIGFMLLNSVLNKDPVQPQLQTISDNNQTIIAITGEASSGLSTYSLQTQNATLLATTSSDNTQLKAYYKKRYHKDIKPPRAKSSQAEELKDSQPGSNYDGKYKSSLQQLLRTNTTAIKSSFEQTQNKELRELLQRLYNNQATALQQLDKQ